PAWAAARLDGRAGLRAAGRGGSRGGRPLAGPASGRDNRAGETGGRVRWPFVGRSVGERHRDAATPARRDDGQVQAAPPGLGGADVATMARQVGGWLVPSRADPPRRSVRGPSPRPRPRYRAMP